MAMSLSNNIQIIILAAGKGARMKSQKPKILQTLAGMSLLQRVVNTSQQLTNDISVIYGFGGDEVKTCTTGNINWIYQKSQNGTGGAIKVALPHIDRNKTCVILYGDVVLIETKTLTMLIENSNQSNFSLLTINLKNPTGYGRVIRQNNQITLIVEEKDTNEEQALTTEINTGIMAISGALLHKYIPNLQPNNAQGELYLTDIVAMAKKDKVEIIGTTALNPLEVTGINDKIQLSNLERDYQSQLAHRFMQQGLTIIDAKRFDCRGNFSFGPDCEIDINTIVENTTLGQNVKVGANCVLKNTKIGDNVDILPNSMVENSIIENNVSIGPFTRIRPETIIKTGSKIGNFVEIKKSNIGENSKINHLSYIGDSEIGKTVNIGAGVITCNYDGVNKHQTIIKNGAFIGSNSALIAPVEIGTNATIGAGSVISKNAESDKLTLTRAKQLNLKQRRPIKNV